MIEIRKEESKDRDAVHHLNLIAFDNGPEAVLVDKPYRCKSRRAPESPAQNQRDKKAERVNSCSKST
ncbi:MAG: hypothetical protein PVI89_17745, partial [Desulfobacteraceae bacterium]